MKTNRKTYLLDPWWHWQPQRASGIDLSQKLHLQLQLQKCNSRGPAGPWQWHSYPLVRSAGACSQCYCHRARTRPAPSCTACRVSDRSHRFFPRCLQGDSTPSSLWFGWCWKWGSAVQMEALRKPKVSEWINKTSQKQNKQTKGSTRGVKLVAQLPHRKLAEMLSFT